jgi:hypothetical protein
MARSDFGRARGRRPALRRARVALGACLAVGLPLLVACNSLIGLSDFEKGACAGGEPCGEGGLPDQLADGGPDAQEDVRTDVKGADPVSWAKWPMPNYGEGGAGAPPRPPLLTSPDAGDVVTDNVTKLVWWSALLPEVTSSEAADDACRKLTDGQWRAPKRIELVTLLDYSKTAAPYVDSTKFKGIINDVVWTTSEVRPLAASRNEQLYWLVDFTNGSVLRQPSPSFKADVLCVRAK